jgi:outer membrane protein TolC
MIMITNQYHAGMVSYLNVVTAQTLSQNNEQAMIEILGGGSPPASC